MDSRQTFVLNIIGNQKDTWQGTLQWMQGRKKCPFRSMLELLRLIDSVISEEDSFDNGQKVPENNLWSTDTADT